MLRQKILTISVYEDSKEGNEKYADNYNYYRSLHLEPPSFKNRDRYPHDYRCIQDSIYAYRSNYPKRQRIPEVDNSYSHVEKFKMRQNIV